MRILVTGANGHIGCTLVPLLLDGGHEVVPFVRSSSNTAGLDPLALNYVRGDVLDADALVGAAEGCDAIIHLAAVYSMSNDPEVVMKPAVEGARNVIGAAKVHGIGRVVYTSSTVSVGWSSDRSLLDESSWSDDSVLPYAIAKRDAERIATRMADEAGVALVILNPTIILGPNDYRPTPSSEILLNWLSGRAQTVPGGLSLVDVRDVALAHARALDRGAHGERHILCAGNFEQREFGRRLREAFGIGPTHMPLPRGMLIPSVAAMEVGYRLIGKRPVFTRSQANEWAGRWAWFDGSKATRVFGFAYRDVETTLLDAVRWFAEAGMLPARAQRKIERHLADRQVTASP